MATTQTKDAVAVFCDATRARDVDRIVSTLAPDSELLSPLSRMNVPARAIGFSFPLHRSNRGRMAVAQTDSALGFDTRQGKHMPTSGS